MPKGYVIARVDVTDPEAYARYAAAATKAIADHGGRALARGGRYEALEGTARARNVVLEFESYDAARRYFHSAQYQAARALREGAAQIEIVLVEGSVRDGRHAALRDGRRRAHGQDARQDDRGNAGRRR